MPHCQVSKAKVTNALKIMLTEKARTEKQLKEVRSKLKEELVDVSDVAHQKMKDLVDSAVLGRTKEVIFSKARMHEMAPNDGQVCHSFALTKSIHLPYPARSWSAQVTS